MRRRLKNKDLVIQEMEKILEKWDSYPTLDLGKRQGHTDYIDFIRPNEVPNPITVGIDIFSRPFCVIRVVGVRNGKLVHFSNTFFQRYTDSNLWVAAYAGGKQLLDTCGGMREEQFEFVKKICEGETFNESPCPVHHEADEVKNFRLATFAEL